jgi:hypothetical protein
MPYLPSRRLETLAATLIPPSAREHVLGDLAECAHTRRQYLTAFAAVLPRIVFSEAQRKLRAGAGVGLMAGLSAVSLVVAALVTRGRALAEAGEWLHWVAPWAVWVTGCALAAAYGAAGTRLWSGWGVLGALLAAIATGALAGAHVGAVVGALLAATGMHIAMTFRRVAADLPRLASAVPALTLENVDEQARAFQRGVRWRNARESAAAIALLVFNSYRVLTSSLDSPAAWIEPALLVAGLAVLLYALHVKGGSHRVPAGLNSRALLHFHRGQIERQRNVLRAVPWWYLLPLAPGMIAGALLKWDPVATPVALVIMAAIFYGIARLNAWGARWLDDKLAEAQGLDRAG